jgi:hypothetical protein
MTVQRCTSIFNHTSVSSLPMAAKLSDPRDGHAVTQGKAAVVRSSLKTATFTL